MDSLRSMLAMLGGQGGSSMYDPNLEISAGAKGGTGGTAMTSIYSPQINQSADTRYAYDMRQQDQNPLAAMLAMLQGAQGGGQGGGQKPQASTYLDPKYVAQYMDPQHGKVGTSYTMPAGYTTANTQVGTTIGNYGTSGGPTGQGRPSGGGSGRMG